uniref:Uncharacterized protein n=1 Tax=Arcella intermedia TaxID=1963864 RepID=A0A6B2L1X9_9EUKA
MGAKRVKELESQLGSREEQWKRWEDDYKGTVAKLKSSLETEKQQVGELREGIDKQKREYLLEITNLKAQLQDALNQNLVLSQKVNNQSSEAVLLRSTFDSKSLEVETIRNQNLELKRGLETAQILNEQARIKSAQDLERINGLQQQVDMKQEQIGLLKAQLASKIEDSTPNSSPSLISEATIADLNNQIKKLTYENGKLLVEKRSLLKNGPKNGSEVSQKWEQQITELNKLLELEKGNSEKLLREVQLKATENNEGKIQFNQLQQNLQDLNDKLLHQKNKIKTLKSLKKEKQDFNQLQEELLLKQQEITKLETENQTLLNQIRKSSEVVTRLIEENSTMIHEQQYKKKLNTTLERAASISSLMSEKQFLCSQLHLKNIALEKEIQEKNELQQRLLYYEQQGNSHNDVQIPITTAQYQLNSPVVATESPKPVRTSSHEDLPKSPLVDPQVSLPETALPPAPVSSGELHIDQTFKPTHENIVVPQPVSKGWWSSIWDVVSGRV